MKLSISIKKRATHHVVYEIMMFKVTSQLLTSGITDQALKNVLLESFAIHSRNLFDFFYKKRVKDDMIVDDFVANIQAFKKHKSKKRDLKNLAKKDNKQVSHLTYARLNYNLKTKRWRISDITSRLNVTVMAFLNSLGNEEKVWFDNEFKKWGVTDSSKVFHV